MKRVSLNGVWQLSILPPGDEKEQGRERSVGSGTIEAAVPGNVELDLSRAGLLPEDLYLDSAISTVQGLERYEFLYSRDLPDAAALKARAEAGDRIVLHLEGVDCIADYRVGDTQVGSSRNMLIPVSIDITDAVAAGETALSVRLRSPIDEAEAVSREFATPGGVTFASNHESLRIRKAPHSYGWDIMPRALSAGLWRDVWIEIVSTPRIDDLYIATVSAEDDRARLYFWYAVDRGGLPLEGLSLRVSGRCGDSKIENTLPVFHTVGSHDLWVERPALWWPRGYGEPNLYDVSVELLVDGRVVDQKSLALGIRTAELDTAGTFRMIVNGEPVFCRGTNWVCLDVFHSRDAERVDAALDMVEELDCTMVRAWGGSVYEHDAFFDRCDRAGVMVWQDFAMACGAYPQDDAFASVMSGEVSAVARRLRNHPCLVLWCGDNECDTFTAKRRIDPSRNRLTRSVIPGVLASVDPYRSYVPSSPYVSPEVYAEGEFDRMPEKHLWGPRAYFKDPFYSDADAAFIGEVGYHGCPNVSSIRRFVSPEHLWPWQDNEVWRLHGTASEGRDMRSAFRIDLMIRQVEAYFGVRPDSLEELALLSQISQAEAKKYFVEMSRARKGRQWGVLWWNLLDGWPQFSDAVVDYYFGKKLAYHYLRRSQAAVCVFIGEPDGWTAPVVAVNDTLRPRELSVRVTRECDGEEIVARTAVAIPSNGVRVIGSVPVSRGVHELFLLSYSPAESAGNPSGNHYVSGLPPFDPQEYRRWLPSIAGLEPNFEAGAVGV